MTASKPRRMFTCAVCSRRFRGQRRSARYCSSACRQASYRDNAAHRAAASILDGWQASLTDRGIAIPDELSSTLDDLIAFAKS